LLGLLTLGLIAASIYFGWAGYPIWLCILLALGLLGLRVQMNPRSLISLQREIGNKRGWIASGIVSLLMVALLYSIGYGLALAV